MGFAAPLLSLTRLSLKVFPAALSASTSRHSSCAQDEPQDFSNHYPNVFTMRKSSKRQTGRRSAGRSGSANQTSGAQLNLPWLAEDETTSPATPRLLKIVQREPRKQPECLLISGRMADVCAALERMERNESGQADHIGLQTMRC